MTRRTAPMLVAAVVLLMTAACSGNTIGGPPTDVTISVPGGVVTIPIPPDPTVPVAPTTPEVFEPAIPLPSGFPVYPGAVLWADIPYDPTNYVYMFSSDAPREDVCEFYVAALEAEGFEVTDLYEGTELGSCNPREVVIEGTRGGGAVVGVFSTEGDSGFMVWIDHEAWQGGWFGG